MGDPKTRSALDVGRLEKPMGVDYGWEKFYSALRYALQSNESLQERLESVIIGVCHLQRDSFPSDESWEHFDSLMKETMKRAARTSHEGTIHATTSQMSDEEAGRLLESAFDLFSDLAEKYGAERAR
jgi:hypothetical protein